MVLGAYIAGCGAIDFHQFRTGGILIETETPGFPLLAVHIHRRGVKVHPVRPPEATAQVHVEQPHQPRFRAPQVGGVVDHVTQSLDVLGLVDGSEVSAVLGTQIRGHVVPGDAEFVTFAVDADPGQRTGDSTWVQESKIKERNVELTQPAPM